MCWRRTTVCLFVIKIYRTPCSIVKIKPLKTSSKFVKYTCLSYKVENIIEQSAVKACYKECDEEQYVVQPCSSDKCSVERVAVRYRYDCADCVLCKSEMMRMQCCEKFLPKMNLDNNIFEYVQCSSCVCNAISCVCNAINNLPTKAISWNCQNFECPAFIVYCNCGRVNFQNLNSPYRCLLPMSTNAMLKWELILLKR